MCRAYSDPTIPKIALPSNWGALRRWPLCFRVAFAVSKTLVTSGPVANSLCHFFWQHMQALQEAVIHVHLHVLTSRMITQPNEGAQPNDTHPRFGPRSRMTSAHALGIHLLFGESRNPAESLSQLQSVFRDCDILQPPMKHVIRDPYMIHLNIAL